MKNAVLDLKTKPDVVLVDGLDKKDINIPNENIIKGDSKIDCIMAASIIAKVKRDDLMKEYSISTLNLVLRKIKDMEQNFT